MMQCNSIQYNAMHKFVRVLYKYDVAHYKPQPSLQASSSHKSQGDGRNSV